MTTGARFRFGDFELDSAQFELRRAGLRVEVQPKVLRLLCHLVEHRARAVDNAELLHTLWPDAKVTPGSIKRAVLGARQALGERAASQASIRTVRGLGYQFVREVEPLGGMPESAEARRKLRGSQDVFLGREGVLELIETSLQEVLQGATRCIVLTGGPGLGKTRTAEELYRRARKLGVHTWLGRCPDMEGVPAFWPFIQVLRAARSDRGADAMQRYLGREGGDMAGAMPELRKLLEGLPESEAQSTQAARFRLYDGMVCFLRRAAEDQPLVLGLDDLHHADPATLQLLTFLSRHLVDARVLIVGTFRREAQSEQAVPPLLEALVRQDPLRCIELRGFSPAELAHYLELTAGAAPPEELVALLHEQTAGNPLFVRHVIENWRALGEPTPDEPFRGLTSLSLSQGLRGAIIRHLEVITPACRALLRTAAVLGRDFSAAHLARLSEQSIAEVCTSLADAEATGLIQQLPAAVASYRFTHALVRDALYAQLSAAERCALHGRAGRALEALAGGAQSYVHLAEITRHFVLAAPAHDEGRAFGYSVRAAESALARLAHEEAAEHFEHALQLSAYEPPDRARYLSLLLRKGDALARTSDPDTGRAALFEAAELATQLGDHETLYTAASLLAGRPEPGRVDEAQLAVLERAHAALAPEDGRRVLLLAMQGKSLVYATTSDERVRRGRLALQQARALPDPALRAEALTRCLDALAGPDQLEERTEIAASMLRMAQAEGDASALLQAWAAQIEICVERADMPGVETALSSMEELAVRLRDPLYRWQARAVRSMQAFVQGRLLRSEQLAKEALQLGVTISEELARHIYCAQSFGLSLMLGKSDEAEKLGREMAERYPGIAGWVAAAGICDAILGRSAAARSCLDHVMGRGIGWIRSEPYLLSGLCSVSELCQLVGDASAARALYAATLPYAEHHGLTHTGACNYGPMQRQLAALAACFNDLACAERHFREALRGAQALRSPTYESVTSMSHAVLLLEGAPERREEAQTLLARARQLAASCDMVGIVYACDSVSNRHGLGQSNVISLPAPRRSSRS